MFLVLLVGVLGCGWTLYFTDWFPVVGGVLTLGGALSWLAFVSRVLPEDRLKEMQGHFFDSFFNSRWTTRALISLLAAGVVATSLFGTVQIEPIQQPVDRQVWVKPFVPDGAAAWDTEDFERLPVGGLLKCIRWTGWGRADYVVKVSGFPDGVVSLRPWRRTDLYLPSSFRRPVILLRPSENWRRALPNNPATLEVRLDGHTNRMTFSGRAVWIGCDENVELPSSVFEAWQRTADKSLLNQWLPPQALASRRVELNAGGNVRVRVVRSVGSEEHVVAHTNYIVKPLPPRLEFSPQVEDLHAP